MRRKSQIVSFIIAITWLLVGVGFCFPQNISVDSLNKALIADAGLSSVDLESIRKGKVVTRLLPSTDKREVAVLGITRIDLPVGVVRESFRTAIRKQEKKTTLQSGSFGDPVDFEDIANLKMEEKDLRDLKDCRIKNVTSGYRHQ